MFIWEIQKLHAISVQIDPKLIILVEPDITFQQKSKTNSYIL